jgi:hypothetical protein
LDFVRVPCLNPFLLSSSLLLSLIGEPLLLPFFSVISLSVSVSLKGRGGLIVRVIVSIQVFAYRCGAVGEDRQDLVTRGVFLFRACAYSSRREPTEGRDITGFEPVCLSGFLSLIILSLVAKAALNIV